MGQSETSRHKLGQVVDQGEVGVHILAAHDFLDCFLTARRADPAGGALAAAFDLVEFEGEAGHFRHIGRVVSSNTTTPPWLLRASGRLRTALRRLWEGRDATRPA